MSAPDQPSPIIVEEIARIAAGLAAAERAAYLDVACEGKPAVRARVERLLEAREIGAALHQAVDNLASTELETDTKDPNPEAGGERIGNYKLLEQIGEGGFGIVWMAEQVEPVRRRVALKIIKPGMDTKEVIARFEQERQALALMDHANIAKVFDAGATEHGRPFFVMELVRGIRITEYCDRNNLPTTERLTLFIAVCNAVQHAHQKGIIHRDLKPSNILVTLHDGVPVPKVIDFGVAKATQSQRLTDLTLFTHFEQMIGTPLYMSPEQAEMSGLDIDTRSDIYSLGVLLYELLTGRTPFDPEELMRKGLDEIRRTIREQEPLKPSTALATMVAQARTTVARHRKVDGAKLVGLIRGDLDWIVMKALEKDRTRRYETANALVLDIQRHLKREPVLARSSSGIYRFRRMVQRNKITVAAGTAVAVAFIIGSGVSTWQAIRANTALADLRETAPAFAAQARGLVAMEQFAEAIERLDVAIKLRPKAPEYLLAKADLLESQLRFAEAGPIYQAALKLSPGNERATKHIELCKKLAAEYAAQSKLTLGSLAELMARMKAEHRSTAEMMPIARITQEDGKLIRDYWIERLAELSVPPEKPLIERLSVGERGLSMDLGDFDVSDFHLLRGMPLNDLDARGPGLVDLRFVEGMPLHRLKLTAGLETVDLRPLSGLPLKVLHLQIYAMDLAHLGKIRSLEELRLISWMLSDLSGLRGLSLRELSLAGYVSDLSPLQGMPIHSLELLYCPVKDLASLAGMPLTTLKINGIPATDLSPLVGAPLQELKITWSGVQDLSFLSGMPLKSLILEDCDDARHFQTLASLTKLENLVLPEGVMSLPPEELDSIEALSKHPTLRHIGMQGAYVSEKGFRPETQSKDAFWKQWDNDVPWIRALHRAGVKFDLVRNHSSRRGFSGFVPWRLTISTQLFSELAILKGAHIERLDLANTEVSDLTPLIGMPLKDLSLHGTRVTDLTPLAGMPLTVLNVSETSVSNLAVLRSAPLRASLVQLRVSGSKISDFSPVADCAALESFSASNTALRDLEALRGRKLFNLQITNTQVRDLSPITDMPLQAIGFDGTDISDVTPLLSCPMLERILLSRNARNVEALRALPRVQLISFKAAEDGTPSQSAEEFWAGFSSGKR